MGDAELLAHASAAFETAFAAITGTATVIMAAAALLTLIRLRRSAA